MASLLTAASLSPVELSAQLTTAANYEERKTADSVTHIHATVLIYDTCNDMLIKLILEGVAQKFTHRADERKITKKKKVEKKSE